LNADNVGSGVRVSGAVKFIAGLLLLPVGVVAVVYVFSLFW